MTPEQIEKYEKLKTKISNLNNFISNVEKYNISSMYNIPYLDDEYKTYILDYLKGQLKILESQYEQI